MIQKSQQPIILTGYSALNKLLGRQVYSSNVQLGGTDIMYGNGVSHLTVEDDMSAMLLVLSLTSYVPTAKGRPLPLLPPAYNDPLNRPIDFVPTKAPYDPRHMLAGCKVVDAAGATAAVGPPASSPTTTAVAAAAATTYLSGFLDRDSFTELLGGWAKTVVVGRGRLGGLPIGVIAVETRSVEQTTPADPAAPDSKENVELKAGQVWYPDSE